MDIRVQILDDVPRNHAFERSLGLCVGGALAAAVTPFLLAIAIDVHVCEGASAVQEDRFTVYTFLAVGPVCGGKRIGG